MLNRWRIVDNTSSVHCLCTVKKDIFSLYKGAGFVKLLILGCITAQKRKQPALANPDQDQDNRSAVQYRMTWMFPWIHPTWMKHLIYLCNEESETVEVQCS